MTELSVGVPTEHLTDYTYWRELYGEAVQMGQGVLNAVRDLHKPYFSTVVKKQFCDHCRVRYPCETIQAVEKAMRP